MSLQTLRSPVLPSSALSRPLLTRGSKDEEIDVLGPSSSSSRLSPQKISAAFGRGTEEYSRAVSDTHTSHNEGAEQSSTAECSLPYLLLSEALAGLPATFKAKASDSAPFYSYLDAAGPQKEAGSSLAEDNTSSGGFYLKEAPTNGGFVDLVTTGSCEQETELQALFPAFPPSLRRSVSPLKTCQTGSLAGKAFAPFEDALASVGNYLNGEIPESGEQSYTPSAVEKAFQNDVDVKLAGAQLSKDLATVSEELVPCEAGESPVVAAPYDPSATSSQHLVQAADLCETSGDLTSATGIESVTTYVPKPEDLERIAYVIRGFGLSPSSSLPAGPSSGPHQHREDEVFLGNDLAQFIGRRHTLPAKGPLEISRSSEEEQSADRGVPRRCSGPFLLPVFPFCDSESAGPVSERVTATHLAAVKEDESPLSKSSVQSGQAREEGDAEVTRRNHRDGGNVEQAKYTLIVNVPPTTTRQDLHLTFSAFGVVELTVVVCDKDHRHPNKEWTATSGYAFVRFSKTEEAAAAVAAAALGTVRLRGNRVRATWAKKDSVPKHANGGSTVAGHGRSTTGNGKGRSRASEPGIPAQVSCLYQRMEDRELKEKQHRVGVLATALERDRHCASPEIPVHTYGFKVPLTLCSTPESAQEFACHICRTYLAADPIVLPCWHIFCNECLQQWKRHFTGEKEIEYCCPTCGMWTTTALEKKMDEAAGGPLFKLRQVRDAENVICFYAPRCRWTGPLSCITTHMRLHTCFRNPA